MFTFNHKISIYAPSTMNGVFAGVAFVQSQLGKWFGGFTSLNTTGGYVSMAGDLVVEPITIVYAFTDDYGLQKYKSDVITLAHSIATSMQQESVAYEIDGVMYLVMR